jgi:hypothetical protein
MPSLIGQPAGFAITGHGRSGTSLVAAMLQSGGLEIGERLMGPSEANKYGYFEDLDFHELHVAVLRAQGLHETGFIVQPSVPVPSPYAQLAHRLVQQRMRRGRPWGWKEPRTTLFLDFWYQLIPRFHCILLFRAPWEVIDSLFRRGDANFLNNPCLAVRVWLNYNRALLDFYHRHPARCLLVESFAVAREPSRLIEAIAGKFGHHFGPVEDLYDEAIYSHPMSPQHRAVLARWFAEAIELYEELRAKADVVVAQEALSAPLAHSDNEEWGLQHWVDWRCAERQLKQCQMELEQTRAELRRLQSAIQRDSSADPSGARVPPWRARTG